VLKPLSQYIRDEAVPRWKGIIISWEAVISVLVALAFFRFGNRLFSTFPKISDITTGLIAYASIALGFCVAGLTISLTFPEPKFTSHLAAPLHHGDKKNHYSDLLFVFSWTALAHWIAVMALFSVVLFTDGSTPLLPDGHSTWRIGIVAVLGGLCAYCLCQFLITVITLSQVGNLYVQFLSKKIKQDDQEQWEEKQTES